MREIMTCFIGCLPLLGLAGCTAMQDNARLTTRVELVVAYTTDRMDIDGRLSEPIWSACKTYPLGLARQDSSVGQELQEPGRVRFVCDQHWLYVGIHFDDTDVVAEGDQDQLHHYQFGDVAELFIKPLDHTWYWELYVTPTGLKSAFFIPGRGRLPLPSNFVYTSGLRVGARIDGTLNNWRDVDSGWTAEMAVPLEELAIDGKPVELDHLTVLVARYNYSRYLSARELTTLPVQNSVNFHQYEEYARVTLDAGTMHSREHTASESDHVSVFPRPIADPVSKR